MPHITVKLWPGKTEEQKRRLAGKIVENATRILNYGEESFSVSFEQVEPGDWKEKVYTPDIINGNGKLYKKPGYTM